MGGSVSGALKAVGNQMVSTATVGQKNNAFGGGQTTWSMIEDNDMVRGLTGRATSAERLAKGEQEAALASAKAEADRALDVRRGRMSKKAQGRGSLLSGTELGLSSTLG